MDYFQTLAARQSIRAYQKKPIEPEKMAQLLEATRSAPTAGNLQAYRVYLVESPNKIVQLSAAAYNQRHRTDAGSEHNFIAEAPAVMVFCVDPDRSAAKYGDRGRSLYCVLDTMIATTIAHLTTFALGLGSVMVGAIDEEKVADVIDLPENLWPLLLLPIGYPAETPERTDRLSMDELVVRV
jgi:nitroreductase